MKTAPAAHATSDALWMGRWISLQPAACIQVLYAQLGEDLHSGRLTLLPVPATGLRQALPGCRK
ncbi:hypothetical protein [Chitinophaga parva]|uniref:hypothetical protein n=1 Tax=Chitinophaga parva TaxID=2169414 RepID=UPI001057223F|nr:hypothetical protein [Chitinophaga parva]